MCWETQAGGGVRGSNMGVLGGPGVGAQVWAVQIWEGITKSGHWYPLTPL